MSALNPRWVAYLRTTNDPRTWEFMAWVDRHWRAWERQRGRPPHSPKSEADHDDFSAWVSENVLAHTNVPAYN